MPTSAQISEMKREQLRQKETERLDSMVRAESQNATAETPKQLEVNRFHVIFGCFMMQENAARMMAQLTHSGYKPVEMRFRNGLSAVSAASFDNYTEAHRSMRQLLERVPYTPYDVWIYDLRQNLHGGTNDYHRMRNDDYRVINVNEDYRRMNENFRLNEEFRRMNEVYRLQEEFRRMNENAPVN